jgi:hypothetical protein
MPVDFLKPERRKLSELAPGATACVDFFAIAVDLSGKTYIDLDSRVYEEPHSKMVTVREMDGGLHSLYLSRNVPGMIPCCSLLGVS